MNRVPTEEDAVSVVSADRALRQLPATLVLRNVSFRHADGGPWVLRHVSMALGAGEMLVLTGASGSGKTTLLKIMSGQLMPTEGEVLYGGVPMRRLGLGAVRRLMGLVMPHDGLQPGSVADNICGFATEPDWPRMLACARLVNLREEIASLPMGYDTWMDDSGDGVSSGQRQRLLLARALYRRPRLLALDHATSQLDAATERTVFATLGAMKLTRLVVTSRPEALTCARRVMRVAGGQVREAMRAVPGDDPRAGWERRVDIAVG